MNRSFRKKKQNFCGILSLRMCPNKIYIGLLKLYGLQVPTVFRIPSGMKWPYFVHLDNRNSMKMFLVIKNLLILCHFYSSNLGILNDEH